jgi:hypothetical protein
VWEEPWGRFDFATAEGRAAAARVIAEREFDVLIASPVSRVGMDAAGTLQEVRDFMRLVDEVRRESGRLVATILVHHENPAGRVSGAWEGATDTLIHVTGQGHGSTGVYIQKARWASAYHAQTLQLVWTPGDGFALNEQPEVTEQDIETQLISAVKASRLERSPDRRRVPLCPASDTPPIVPVARHAGRRGRRRGWNASKRRCSTCACNCTRPRLLELAGFGGRGSGATPPSPTRSARLRLDGL